MTPYLMVVDELLPPGEFELLREHTQLITYEDRKGPDGKFYAGVSEVVPNTIKERLTHAFSWLIGQRVVIKICAFRLSLMGTVPPQWAHSDLSVSNYAAFLYMNPGPGGTVLLRHKETGLDCHPRDEDELAILLRDQNNMDAWQIIGGADCYPNRGVIIPSARLHAAMPVYGYGSDAKDGRLILWTFFD